MTTPAIPPPAKVPSDPPNVKISNGHNALAQNLGIGAMFTLAFLCRQDFSVEAYVTAMLTGLGVVNLPVFFGKPRGSTGGITLLASMPKLAGGALTWLARGHAGPFMAALLMLTGCAGADLPSADTLRTTLNKQAEAMNRLGNGIAAACKPDPTPAWCAEASQDFNDIAAAHKLAQDFADLYGMVSQ